MSLKDVSKIELEEMIRVEVKSLKNFLKKINEETKYETNAFSKISLIDDEEREIRTKSLKFGDRDLLKTIVLRDELLTLVDEEDNDEI